MSRPGELPETVVSALAPAVETLRKTLPASYNIVVGGTVEESKTSQASVIAVVPIMLLIMFTVLMVQLQSFQRLFLVLSVAPLGLIGVVAALLLSGRPLGFVAILGILALLGMITKNAVILIGQIEAERRPGKKRVGRCAGCQQLALPPHHADGRIYRSRHDTDCSDGILGADGLRDHGRLVGRNDPDADLSADFVCRLVQGNGANIRSFPIETCVVTQRQALALASTSGRQTSSRISRFFHCARLRRSQPKPAKPFAFAIRVIPHLELGDHLISRCIPPVHPADAF